MAGSLSLSHVNKPSRAPLAVFFCDVRSSELVASFDLSVTSRCHGNVCVLAGIPRKAWVIIIMAIVILSVLAVASASLLYGGPGLLGASVYGAPGLVAVAPVVAPAPGYVAATRGSLHVAPLPGNIPYASHHINLAPAPGTH
uniref:Uncharacterized protein n=1 Tax=Timema tahoe TaxID=61484 RepID=A0A7R9IHF7_9NEOP|nr:unnamed protein product [Timema tahoe]